MVSLPRGIRMAARHICPGPRVCQYIDKGGSMTREKIADGVSDDENPEWTERGFAQQDGG
jgi:hypothetical protein